MAFLYITEQGATVRKTGDRLIVERQGEKLLDVECHKIEAILIFGGVQVTTQAIDELFYHGIELAFLTIDGRLKGQLTPVKAKNVELRMAQYRRYCDPDFALATAKTFVAGKIANSLKLIKNYLSNYPEADLDREAKALRAYQLEASRQESMEGLLGLEGSAARVHFSALAKMFRSDELRFPGRRSRPATDPINALLSFGYTLVCREIQSILDAVGFDPYIGFLHQLDYGRPSLALDLLEEFRPALVDRLTLALINRKELVADDFYSDQESGACYLKREAMRKYFQKYEGWLNREFTDAATGQATTFRKAFLAQAHRAANHILGKDEYQPFTTG